MPGSTGPDVRTGAADGAAHAQARRVAADRLRAAAKTDDSTYATFVVTPLSLRLVRPLARLGASPSAVTAASLAVALVAASAFALGTRAAVVAGAVLLQAAFVLDCADGQLARYTGRVSAFGAWLDGMADRAKEYAVFAGLAVGSVRGHGDDVWVLAAAALTLQTVRHLTDASFGLQRDAPGAAVPVRRRAALRPPVGTGRRNAPWVRWAASSAVLPIGERYALISLTVVLWTPRDTFEVLLTWGILAFGYILGRKVAASRRLPRRSLGWVVEAMRDDGPFASGIRASRRRAAAATPPRSSPGGGPRVGRSLAWLMPPAIRLVEYGLILLVAVRAGGSASPACYALFAACAYHHYDIADRIRTARAAPARLVGLVCGGWDGRLLLAVGLAATGFVTAGYLAAAVVSAALFLAESARFWVTRRAAVPLGRAASVRTREVVADDRTDSRGGCRSSPAPADGRPAEGAPAGLR